MRIKRRHGVAVAIATAALALGAAAPAQAFGSGNDIGGLCGGGWAWSSSYISSSGTNYANTTKSGNICDISVAIRIYTNAYNRVNSSATVVETTRYGVAASGGYHYNGTGVRNS